MTAPRFTLSEDGAVVISHTVATLNARAMFARLRSLIARCSAVPDDRAELCEELDALVDQTTDVLWAFAGTVDEQTAAMVERQRNEARDLAEEREGEVDEKQDEIRELERQIEELEEAANDEPESLQAKHAAALHEIATLKGQAEKRKADMAKARAFVGNVESLNRAVQYVFQASRHEARKSKAAVTALDAAQKGVVAAIERATT